MSAQLTLDDYAPGHRPPRARRSDPLSSHQAADEAERSGRIGRQLAATVELVRAHPGRTSLELAQLGVLDRHQLGRRLPEAERRGLVRSDRDDPARARGADLRWWSVSS